MLVMFILGVYKIFNNANKDFKLSDKISQDEVVEINSNNYTNILKAVHENIDSYVGIKVHFTGFVYRLIDFNDNEFVLSRNMIINSSNQAVVVGFLCTSETANEFADNTWVEVTGTIKKGNYHGDIPVIEVTKMNITDVPTDEFVYPPEDSYIPTNALL